MYTNSESTQQATPTSRYRGVSFTKPITAAKEAVPTLDVADLLCGPGGLRKVGDKWVGRCPLPEHEDRSPSFTVYPETSSWFCFGCLHGGDVVELYMLGTGCHDPRAAAAELLMQYGHEVPQRPPAWFAKQKRQQPVRDLVYKAKVETLTRRLWRYVIEPIVAEIEDPDERAESAARLWGALEMRTRQMIR